MESKLNLIEQLLENGNKFTFHNFCYPSDYEPHNFSGDDTPEWLQWKTRVNNIVNESMAENSPASKLVAEALRIQTSGYSTSEFERVKSSLLTALNDTKNALKIDIYGELRKKESNSTSPALSNKVFIVHGHDSELKTDLERFIHEIGLEPIVLHRQADNGNTIIEKFEKNSDVGYVFVLLTPDEIAFTADQIDIADDIRKKEYRARPNVIFEFGYFVAKLGRSRVCCLHKGETAVPSDLSGLIYKKIDASIDSQAYAIIKELKAAGYDIKM